MLSRPRTTSLCRVLLVHTIVGVPGTCLYVWCVVNVLPFVLRSVLSQASGILFWQFVLASDKLAQEHAQRAYDAYHSAHTSEVTRRHLCELHAKF